MPPNYWAEIRIDTTRRRPKPARGRRVQGAGRDDPRSVRREDRATEGGATAAAGVIKMVKVSSPSSVSSRSATRWRTTTATKACSRAFFRRGHAVPRRRNSGRHRAESARRAVADERRPDFENPPRLGRSRARPSDRSDDRRGQRQADVDSIKKRMPRVSSARSGRFRRRLEDEDVVRLARKSNRAFTRSRSSTERRRRRSSRSCGAPACRTPVRPRFTMAGAVRRSAENVTVASCT